MEKSKIELVTKDASCLVKDTSLEEVGLVKKNFLSPPLGKHLLSVVIGNRYLSRSIKENATNITVSSYIIFLLTIPFLNFIIIH